MTDDDGVPLSVVMVSRGDPTLLRVTVPAALAAGFEPSRDELLVVIDGPGPDQQRVVEELTALSSSVRVLILSDCRGTGPARLYAVGQARHDTVVLLDDGFALTSVALQEHRQFHTQGNGLPGLLVGARETGEPSVSTVDDLPASLAAQDDRDRMNAWSAAPHTMAQTLTTGHWSLRRADLLAAESVMPTQRLDHFDDTDLGLRLSVVGVRMHFSEQATGQQLRRHDLRSYLAEAAERGRSAALLARRWPTVPVGPTAPSGQSFVRTVTSGLFRQPWFVRGVAGWLRRGATQPSARRRAQVLLVRDLVEQAWFDQEVRADDPIRVARVAESPGVAPVMVTRQFANSGRRA